MFFFKFLATDTSQKKLKRHKKAPKKHPKNTKIPKERIQPWNQKLQFFGDNLEPIFKHKGTQKKTKLRHFLRPPSPASQGSK